MLLFLIRRIATLALTFVGVSVLAFAMIRLVPGDPVLLMLGEKGAAPEVYAEMQANLGLDKPLLTQYVQYFTKALQGDLGVSIFSKQPVWDEFITRFPATLELGLMGMFFAVVLGIPLGTIAAVRRNSIIDYFLMGVSLIGYSMPIFWWGLLLILFFAVQWGIAPVSGRIDILYDIPTVTGLMFVDTLLSDEGWPAFWDALHHILLPAIALGTIPLAVIARMTRSSLLEVLGEDYIRTARAKGLNRTRVVFIHALRNAMIPVVTVIGLLFGSIITGAILTETIFSWPGIGKWIVTSVTARDYPVIQGGMLLIAALVITTNLTVDLINSFMNPKLREQR